MKLITLAAAFAAVVTTALGLTINTPSSVVECEPTQLSWSGGTAPYYLTIYPAGQISTTPFEQFPAQNATSYTWIVNLQLGVSCTIAVKDATGASAYTDIVTIQGGSSTSCSTSVAGASATGGSGSSVAGSATATATSASSSSTATSGSSSTTSSGAGRLSVSSALGVAGIMGLVGAAFF